MVRYLATSGFTLAYFCGALSPNSAPSDAAEEGTAGRNKLKIWKRGGLV